MKRLRVTHSTGYRYSGEVSASYNEARMLPASGARQLVLHSALDVEPVSSHHSTPTTGERACWPSTC